MVLVSLVVVVVVVVVVEEAAVVGAGAVGWRCQISTSTSTRTARSTCGGSPSLTGRWPLVVVVAAEWVA